MNTAYYNRTFAHSLRDLNENLSRYNGELFGSEESIKVNASLIAKLEITSHHISYKQNTKLSLMSELLEDYFNRNSNETLKKNSGKINQYISDINKNINAATNIDEFIAYLTPPKK